MQDLLDKPAAELLRRVRAGDGTLDVKAVASEVTAEYGLRLPLGTGADDLIERAAQHAKNEKKGL